MNQFGAPQKKLWYKTDGGIAFIVTLSVLIIIGLVFVVFVGYYMVQIKQGNADVVLDQLNEDAQFTAIMQQDDSRAPNTLDIAPFIRTHNPTFGNTEAPLTIVMFIDFECPFCQQAYPTMRQVMDEYGSAVQVRFKHFPLASIHPNATRAAVATTCAQEQGAFWEYYDLIFENKLLNNVALSSYAQTLELDMPQFDTCLRTERYMAQIEEDFADGRALSVRGTPTYFLNNQKIEGVVNADQWRALILEQL